MSKPAIALYLGESYASIGLFDTSQNPHIVALFEKSIFLPQTSLKSLLNQTKIKIQEFFGDFEAEIPVYIVTKYFERLKQFRLGGSISQIILKDFENSYTLVDSRNLSLAATQLIISLDSAEIKESFLEKELNRIKKINPDLNKVVISIPESALSAEQAELLNNFFTANGLKIFNCSTNHNQHQLRKTLLNAGSEGTKEEIINDLTESFGGNLQISFFYNETFQSQFENCNLFTSATDFLSHYVTSKKYENGAFFDLETLKFLDLCKAEQWLSPWGPIPSNHYNSTDLSIHPYAEVKLNHLSILQIENSVQQLEPGPVIAGRAIKPLIIDLFYNELLHNDLAKNLFPQISQENLKLKIQNLFSVLEKGQKNSSLSITLDEVKKNICETLVNEVLYFGNSKNTLVFGPLVDIYIQDQALRSQNNFSWTKEIMSTAMKDFV